MALALAGRGWAARCRLSALLLLLLVLLVLLLEVCARRGGGAGRGEGEQGAKDAMADDADEPSGIFEAAYRQITGNPVYTATLTPISLMLGAYIKGRVQRLLASLLLTQLQLDRGTTHILRQYAAFQLQDSALVTEISLGDPQGQVQDFTAIEMERIPQRPPETVVFKMAQVSGGHFW